jgi:hypothetical protein
MELARGASRSRRFRVGLRTGPEVVMANLVHNEQVKLAATFWNNLSVAVLFSVFLVPAFYTRHTVLQQTLSIAVGLVAAIGLRLLSHWWLRRLRE